MGEIAENVNVIYKILNTVNNKFYIGSAVNFIKRKKLHLLELRNNEHHSAYLQRSWNKYGENAFIFEKIEYDISDAQLIAREQFYMDSLKPEYNICKIAGSRKGVKMNPESKRKMILRLTGKPIHTAFSKELISDSLMGNKRQLGNRNKRKVTSEILKIVNGLRAQGLGCRKIARIVKLDKGTILNIFNKKFAYE